ncbi:substrate-binding domain-containing protein [Halorubrum ezzemoulense]|uniref:Molybdenum transporter n=1 Tax=Halorubrum ezzemoulense TaxID=337243 RepID=A0A256IX20_HALEZ|nr:MULTISPECIES: substrate-binding domain-containing protein [Halorubrum]MDB2224089.1 substrate-binding domain-containing protein [Halorubrum ezzemoulense]MDB2238019.1 substrate-binding domain-containing protein [Halorubrum ezzemoulense]MDB2240387.1 substrate-binding domain-containing protein [Halorubrum ezzemoulense]MDB2243738.1 substrate-binding domain-containing protein [Halorubrum ezzemoulense]MDB2247488.1 substrate-binding domain-containing protein [Halorubrum ezzemoulense]
MPIQRRKFVAAVGAGAIVGTAGCSSTNDGGSGDGTGGNGTDGGNSAESVGVAGETLTLTTTTSTYDTGLLDAIHPDFEEMYGVTVDAVAQGTGAALETARNGDSDIVMVHARGLEDEFMRNGYGINRRDLMFNDFVIVGPESDPAGIGGTGSATEALTTIAEAEATFVSRGDNSGTHTKELNLWDAAGTDPGGDWYQETGTGMGEALNIANQQGAYTLSDRGTYISQRSEIDLTILVQGPIEGGPEILANPYGVMAVNPGVHENANYDLAMAYIGWITSPGVQEAIAEYQVNGEQLFFPEAVSEDPDFQQYVPEGWSSDDSDA